MHGAEARYESLEVAQIMSLIRQVQNPLVLRQAVPVDIQRIDRPVGVVRSEHDELRFREAVAVAVGIDDRDELAAGGRVDPLGQRSEEHKSELQSHSDLVCRLLLEKK